MHDVKADNAAVVVDNEGTVLTLADGADVALRYAVVVVGITEFVEQLLLHVVTHHTLVGDGAPHVLVLVDVNNGRNSLNAHASEGLLHVTFKSLCLRMVDAVACRGVDPQGTVQCLLNAVDIAVG